MRQTITTLLIAFSCISLAWGANLQPENLDAHTTCSACGMVIMDYAGPHAQIILKDGSHKFYGNLDEALPTIRDPHTKKTIAAIYVQDFSHLTWGSYKNHWIKANTAYYVVDSPHKTAAMGRSDTPFSSLAAARQFQKREGGTLQTYDMLISQPQKTVAHNHAHGHMGAGSDMSTMSMPGGMWMTGLSEMHMSMTGLYDGTQSVNIQPGMGSGYMSVPTSMSMDMLMFHLMYMRDDWSVMLMLNYLHKSMDMTMSMMGTTSDSTMTSQGLGDSVVIGSYNYHFAPRHTLITTLGLSLPTGSINEHGSMGTMPDMTYAYPMQLGSGTVDTKLGLGYRYQTANWVLGLNANTTLRTYKNVHDYALGNVYEADLSNTLRVNQFWIPQLTLQGLIWGNIRGQDPRIEVNLSPLANPNNQGGERINTLIGSTFQGWGFLNNQALTCEVTVPIYQNLDGPQMPLDWAVDVKWSVIF